MAQEWKPPALTEVKLTPAGAEASPARELDKLSSGAYYTEPGGIGHRQRHRDGCWFDVVTRRAIAHSALGIPAPAVGSAIRGQGTRVAGVGDDPAHADGREADSGRCGDQLWRCEESADRPDSQLSGDVDAPAVSRPERVGGARCVLSHVHRDEVHSRRRYQRRRRAGVSRSVAQSTRAPTVGLTIDGDTAGARRPRVHHAEADARGS